MTCLTCKFFNLMNRDMAKVGYGHCAYSMAGCFNSVVHEQCEQYESAPPDVSATRLERIEKSRSVN
jgi:hypothetical protein